MIIDHKIRTSKTEMRERNMCKYKKKENVK